MFLRRLKLFIVQMFPVALNSKHENLTVNFWHAWKWSCCCFCHQSCKLRSCYGKQFRSAILKDAAVAPVASLASWWCSLVSKCLKLVAAGWLSSLIRYQFARKCKYVKALLKQFFTELQHNISGFKQTLPLYTFLAVPGGNGIHCSCINITLDILYLISYLMVRVAGEGKGYHNDLCLTIIKVI